ncbi:hypothetical protein [Halococcus agarilyticus]|uniref:hypothetical protein n=1 Tax=Halococcus agarilyticus TaxID=1232219 RepID=UPI0012AB50DB|nr:hypothetical protein [Halococcus agarilyticus]
MASENLKVILGLAAVVVGAFVLLVAFTYPTTFCVSGTGIEETCTTDTIATAGVIVAGGIGLLLGGTGIRTAWANW